jgi:hypothetical protein
MTPSTSTKPTMEESVEALSPDEGQKAYANYEGEFSNFVSCSENHEKRKKIEISEQWH